MRRTWNRCPRPRRRARGSARAPRPAASAPRSDVARGVRACGSRGGPRPRTSRASRAGRTRHEAGAAEVRRAVSVPRRGALRRASGVGPREEPSTQRALPQARRAFDRSADTRGARASSARSDDGAGAARFVSRRRPLPLPRAAASPLTDETIDRCPHHRLGGDRNDKTRESLGRAARPVPCGAVAERPRTVPAHLDGCRQVDADRGELRDAFRGCLGGDLGGVQRPRDAQQIAGGFEREGVGVAVVAQASEGSAVRWVDSGGGATFASGGDRYFFNAAMSRCRPAANFTGSASAPRKSPTILSRTAWAMSCRAGFHAPNT